MEICNYAHMQVSWHRPLVEAQLRAGAELLRGKLWRKANALSTRTMLQYFDTTEKAYLTLDLAGFRFWLSDHFILKEHGTGITYQFCSVVFAAKLYDALIEGDYLQWVK